MGEMGNICGVLVVKPEARKTLEDTGIYATTVLEWILGKCSGRVWDGFIWLRRDQWWAIVGTVMNNQVP
jgi:hypothetical protein